LIHAQQGRPIEETANHYRPHSVSRGWVWIDAN